MDDRDPQDGAEPVVHVVDDEDLVRKSTCALIESAGLRAQPSSSGDAFLERRLGDQPGCVVLDLQMPGTNGLEVLRTLQQRGTRLSVVVVTAHGDIKSAVEAMQLGATDFLAKPYAPDALLDAVDRGIAASKARGAEESSATARMLIERLSSRELEVLQALLEGGTNKSIADALQLSPRTVEMHRARLMTKLGVANLSAALRIAYDAGLTGDRRPS